MAALILAGSQALAAELVSGPNGMRWCEKREDLKPYLDAIVTENVDALKPLQDCVVVKAGVEVGVLKEYIEFQPGYRLAQVRVFGNGTSVDGYTLDRWIVRR